MLRSVLVVDDDVSMVALLRLLLEKNGYLVTEAFTHEAAVNLLRDKAFDCAVLDVQLPDKSGLMILQYIRNHSANPVMPVLMVTGKVDEIDAVLGLEMGADDYIHKPVKKRELLARLEGVFRRIEMVRHRSGHRIPLGSYQLETTTHRLEGPDGTVALPPREYALLLLLATNPGRIFSREELLDRVWGEEVAMESRTVDVHIRRLRQKLEAGNTGGAEIETVRGHGYRLMR